MPESYSQVVNSVNISGSQNGFSGLVSVTAVDSVVPVLLNVYINIDSQSGNSTNINVLDLKILTSE
ncbi:MAG: hypothetical protein JW937_06225 [Candidatus Omnitrophica bacterium]|nr:hypothetical protein [Candidatus Omnitrophota bacterium]